MTVDSLVARGRLEAFIVSAALAAVALVAIARRLTD